MTDKTTLNTLLDTIGQRLRANADWHVRNGNAMMALGAETRQIDRALGKDAAQEHYRTRLAALRAADPDDGLSND